MELLEIVSPNVAFPVVGVLLCAFLVFAFGFKSPAQPPSFSYLEDDHKKKKSKKQKVFLKLNALIGKHFFVCFV